MTDKPVKYTAQLKGVRELALAGAADLSWWKDHLAGEGLEPVEADGAAQVLVTGLNARWLAWRFRDLSVSVMARRSGSDETGIFFARAFNTSRFLVFFETRWFKLPYSRSAASVELGDPSFMRLGDDDLFAELGHRKEAVHEEFDYEGPLFLPGRRWLKVHIYGATSTYDFDADRDRFEVAPGFADPVVAGLRASEFRGVRWHVRQSATHARSKTFRFPD